jgi:hypothetical protein
VDGASPGALASPSPKLSNPAQAVRSARNYEIKGGDDILSRIDSQPTSLPSGVPGLCR